MNVKIHPCGPSMKLAFLGEGETEIELIRDVNKTFVNFGPDQR
jgi:hypothetical protein